MTAEAGGKPDPIRLRAPSARAVREAQDGFVAVFGKMGSAWGISRTMAEVVALLYVTGEPLCTDDIMERLQISRGNASMSLRALLDWGIVYRTHKRGDRKEYFEAESDVWTMFRAIVRERTKREVDPLVAGLYEIRDLTERAGAARKKSGDPALDEHHRRLDAMLEFFESLEAVTRRFVSPAGGGLRLAASILGSRAAKRRRAERAVDVKPDQESAGGAA